MKTCRLCNKELPLSQFYPRGDVPSGVRNDCRDCTLSRVGRRNKNNKEEYLLYLRKRQRRNRMEYMKDKKCMRCGSNENLNIHHRNPTNKLYHGTELFSKKKEKRETELAKCDILCKSCHMKFHRKMEKIGRMGGDPNHWFEPTPEQARFHKPTRLWTSPMGVLIQLGKPEEDDNSG